MKTYTTHSKLRTALLAGIFTFGSSIAVFTSCVDSKDPYSPNNGDQGRMGTLTVSSLGREGDFIVAETSETSKTGVSKAYGAVVPDVDTFRVAVLDSKTGTVVKNNIDGKPYEWSTFAEINGSLVTIPSGKYKLQAANVAVEPLAAWEAPYYYGVQDFTVKISELTKADLVCKLANVKVTVAYDQEFLDKVDNPSVRVYTDYTDPTTAKPTYAFLDYPVAETRAGYFKVPAITSERKLYVKVTGTRKEDGKPIGNGEDGQTKIITEVSPMQWHKVKIGYQQSGQLSASVTVDYSTIDSEHTVEIPDGDGIIDGGSNNGNWEDEPGEGPAGKLDIVGANFNGSAFDLTQQLTVSLSNEKNAIDVRFDAPKGIDQLYVTIESEALATLLPGLGLGNGLPFDIANLPTDKPADVDEGMWWVNMFALPDIGILDPNVPIKGKTTHTFSVGGLMTLLGSVAGPAKDEKEVHKFGLKMVDKAGAEEEATLTIYLTE